MNYRPEFVHDWRGREGFSEISLEPLQPTAARELLAHAARRGTLARAAARSADRAQQRQSFLPRRDRAHPGGDECDRRRAGAPVAWLPSWMRFTCRPRCRPLLPPVSTACRRRKNCCCSRHRSSGPTFRWRFWKRWPRCPTRSPGARSAPCRPFGFIHQTNMFPDLEYRFRHVLTREVAYSSLLKEQRRLLHARAVVAIESLYGDRLASHLDDARPPRCARRTLGQSRRVQPATRRAGARARSQSRSGELASRRRCARLRVCLPRRATAETEIDLRSAMRPALLQLGRLDEVLAISRQVEQLARAARRPATPGARLHLPHQLSLPQGRDRADHRLRHALHRIAEACQDEPRSRPSRGNTWVRATTRAGNIGRSRARARAQHRHLDPSASVYAYVSSCAWLAFSLAERGEFDARRAATRATRSRRRRRADTSTTR